MRLSFLLSVATWLLPVGTTCRDLPGTLSYTCGCTEMCFQRGLYIFCRTVFSGEVVPVYTLTCSGLELPFLHVRPNHWGSQSLPGQSFLWMYGSISQ